MIGGQFRVHTGAAVDLGAQVRQGGSDQRKRLRTMSNKLNETKTKHRGSAIRQMRVTIPSNPKIQILPPASIIRIRLQKALRLLKHR